MSKLRLKRLSKLVQITQLERARTRTQILVCMTQKHVLLITMFCCQYHATCSITKICVSVPTLCSHQIKTNWSTTIINHHYPHFSPLPFAQLLSGLRSSLVVLENLYVKSFSVRFSFSAWNLKYILLEYEIQGSWRPSLSIWKRNIDECLQAWYLDPNCLLLIDFYHY